MTYSKGQLQSVESLRSLLEAQLPLDYVVHTFGYGSGVLSQESSASPSSNGIIDVILVVRDSFAFHKVNAKQNPDHYYLRDPSWITWWQRHDSRTAMFINPKVYFNVTEKLKYGVVQLEDLQEDLTDWKYLYLAGRLHKPTVTILDRDSSVPELESNCNLPAALSAGLLLSSTSTLTSGELFCQIASLSYAGDFRMKAGAEDPQKIKKLVYSPGQLDRFSQLYAPALQNLEEQGLLQAIRPSSTGVVSYEWDANSTSAHSLLWKTLPLSLKSRCYDESDHKASRRALQDALPNLVAPAARYQSLKGGITAGPSTAARYAWRKLSKGLLRR